MANERAVVRNSVQDSHQLSVPRVPYSEDEEKLGTKEMTESCRNMTYPVGSLRGTSPVGPLELSQDLLQALTGRQPEEGLTNITHLPGVVVGAILCRLSNPIDVASAFAASRVFWGVAQTAPFRLKLRVSRLRGDALKMASWTRNSLIGIRRTMGSTQELDLAGCAILDGDVAALLVELPSLELLILDGCQKLTSHVADALAMCIRSGPRAVSLQRCFRLGPAAAGNLLSAAAAGGSRLQTLLFSHLDRVDLPQSPILEALEDGTEKGASRVELVESIARRAPGSGLRILALHNCANLGASELASVAEACPCLEIWMLGGSTEGLGLSRPDVVPPEKVDIASSALLRAAKRLSLLRVLEVTFFSTPVIGAIRAQMPSGIRVLDFCEKESVATTARLVAQLKGRSMPGGEYPIGSSEDVSTPDCFIDSLRDEQSRELRDSTQHATPATDESRQGSSGYRYIGERWASCTEDILLTLKAGTNCSDFRRRTPLHIAAARGDADVVANLLFIGASARKMKDSGGATALFLGAESGHAQVCDLLLKGGADVLSSNRTGETPLYISALRGHSTAVEVMLAHCHQHGINWQDAGIYGDGWTPLMAATVADRQAVAQVLLDFASASNEAAEELQPSRLGIIPKPEDILTAIARSQSSTETTSVIPRVSNHSLGSRRMVAPPLVDAQNRYGQTALHIAARKASAWFIDYLLQAGASLDVRDEYGSRPIDVARKLQNSAIEETLKRWQNMQAKSTRASTSGKSSRKRKSKQKKAAAAAEEQREASTETQAAAASGEEKMRADVITLEDIILSLPEGGEFPVDHRQDVTETSQLMPRGS